MNDLFATGRRRAAGATARVKGWVREAFGLDQDATLLVAELTCREPGCPPLETSISLLETGRDPEEHKLHKAVAEITRQDVDELARRRAGMDTEETR
jgi:hypothetical protein